MGLSNVTGASSILQPGVCTSSTRPASPYDGQVIYETDTDKVAVYDSSSWVYKTGTSHIAPALVCVKAETTVSSVASATADNVFTSSYTNYFIIGKYSTSTTSSLRIKFRIGGVSTSTNYNRQYLNGDGTTAQAGRDTGQTSLNIGSYTQNAAVFSLFTAIISCPQLAQETLLKNEMTTNDANYTTGLTVTTNAGNQNSATQFDGIEFLTAAGTFTLTYSIYGYSKTV